MISTERFRPSMEITLNDIFQDFTDPRREILMKRVGIAMDMLEKRMKNQIEANTLSNLQLLFKKQQALKNLEEKLYQKIEENDEYKQKQLIYNHKFQELQAEVAKKQEIIRSVQASAEERSRQLTENYEDLKMKLSGKQRNKSSEDESKAKLKEQILALQKKIDELEMQSEKYEVIIKKMKDSFNQKMQENQFLLKIKEQKLVKDHSESEAAMNSSKIFQIKKEVKPSNFQEKKQSLPKIEKRHQKIQVNLIETQQAQEKQLVDKEIQTENLQLQLNKKNRRQYLEKKPSFVEVEPIRTSNIKEQQFLQSIKSVPSNEPRTPNESKISNYAKKITVQKLTQTESLFEAKISVKKYNSRSVQVELTNKKLEDAYELAKCQLQQLQQKYAAMQYCHRQKYSEMVKFYEQKIVQDKDIQEKELLKLNVLELQHELERSKEEMAKERQILIKLNESLSTSQNIKLLNKFSSNLVEKLQLFRKARIVKSTTVSASKPKRCITTNTPQKHQVGWQDANNQESPDDTILLKSKKLYDSNVQVITVINGEANFRTYTEKNSIKSTANCSEIITEVHKNRNYKKLSQVKRNIPNY